MILGSGPNRIGQGIEFDYCCVHAAMTVRESGRDAVMVNCNPETVSTDYDTSDRLYFEPLTLEDVLGDRRDRAARGRDRAVRRPDAAEARRRPGGGRRADARHLAGGDRPGRGPRALRRAARAPRSSRRRPYATAARSRRGAGRRARGRLPAARAPELRARRPGDGDRLRRRGPRGLPAAGRARAGRSSSTASSRTPSRSTSTRSATAPTSGSAGSCSTSRRPGSTRATRPACCRRTRSGAEMLGEIRAATRDLALALGVVGLLNVQYAVLGGRPVRHRGQPARVAHRAVRLQGDGAAAGQARLPRDARRVAWPTLDLPAEPSATTSSVKEAVLPFDRFQGSDALLGPEMRSTGEVMGDRARLPGRVRQGAGGGRRATARSRAPSSSRSPTPTSPPRSASPRSCTTSASRSSPRAAPPRRSRAWGSRASG